MTRTLSLRREALTGLATAELREVAAGTTDVTRYCTHYRCFTFETCPTIPLRECPAP